MSEEKFYFIGGYIPEELHKKITFLVWKKDTAKVKLLISLLSAATKGLNMDEVNAFYAKRNMIDETKTDTNA